MTETSDEIETYLPSECIAAINETNSKTESMLELWNTYVSNLKNNTNHAQNIHTLQHVQNKNKESIQLQNVLRSSNFKQ